MIFILVLTTDTGRTAQCAGVQSAIQLSNAVSARANGRGRRKLCCCTGAAVDHKRGDEGCKLRPASVEKLI